MRDWINIMWLFIKWIAIYLLYWTGRKILCMWKCSKMHVVHTVTHIYSYATYFPSSTSRVISDMLILTINMNANMDSNIMTVACAYIIRESTYTTNLRNAYPHIHLSRNGILNRMQHTSPSPNAVFHAPHTLIARVHMCHCWTVETLQ